MGINHPPRADSLVNDFLIWFIVLGLFQTIVMLRVNRKAWLMIVVAVLAATIASVPLLYPRLLFGKPIWTLIMGTMVQAFGTSLLLLYFMAHPRDGIVPKRDKLKKNHAYSNGVLATTPFILLWVGIYYLHLVMLIALPELWYFLVYYSPTALFYGLDLGSSRGSWYMSVVFFGITGLIVAIAQQWLMKKYSNYSIPGWHKFTVVGWIFAGIVWWGFRYRHIYLSLTELETALMYGGYLTIPVLFQAVPMNRVFRSGWIWAIVGVLVGLLAVYIRGVPGAGWLSLRNFYGTTLAGLALSFATALIFLWLQSQNKETQSALSE